MNLILIVLILLILLGGGGGYYYGGPAVGGGLGGLLLLVLIDRKSTRLNSSHRCISYAVFFLEKNRGDPSLESRIPSLQERHGKPRCRGLRDCGGAQTPLDMPRRCLFFENLGAPPALPPPPLGDPPRD